MSHRYDNKRDRKIYKRIRKLEKVLIREKSDFDRNIDRINELKEIIFGLQMNLPDEEI